MSKFYITVAGMLTSFSSLLAIYLCSTHTLIIASFSGDRFLPIRYFRAQRGLDYCEGEGWLLEGCWLGREHHKLSLAFSPPIPLIVDRRYFRRSFPQIK